MVFGQIEELEVCGILEDVFVDVAEAFFGPTDDAFTWSKDFFLLFFGAGAPK